MKRNICIVLIFSLLQIVFLQISLAQQDFVPALNIKAEQEPVYCYRVYLLDKADNPYSVERPEDFLSPRAISKRQRYQIEVTEDDLPLTPAYVQTIADMSQRLRVYSQSKWTNTLVMITLDSAFADSVAQLPFVTEVRLIGIYYYSPSKIQNIDNKEDMIFKGRTDEADTGYYGHAYRQIAMHNGHLLHAAGFHGEGMLISMIDGGWNDFEHIDAVRHLYEEGRLIGTYDLVPRRHNVYSGSSHGTYCTSIIAAALADSMVGTAPAATFVLLKSEETEFELPIEEDLWVRAAELSDSLGADVISSSLGYNTFDDTTLYYADYSTCDGETSVASIGATMAARRGIVVCVSAGNEAMEPWHKISRPSDAKEILCVGAVNTDTVYAPFSSCGPSYDGRVKPDVVACGWNTSIVDNDGSVRQGNGTSFACPVIAGLSACLWQSMPQLSALEIMQIIRESGHQYSRPDTLLGYGVPDFYRAWLLHHRDAVGENEAANSFAVYPNPCHTQLMLANAQERNIAYVLYDMMGREIFRSPCFSTNALQTIKMSACGKGIYFLKIYDRDGNSECKKIVKE